MDEKNIKEADELIDSVREVEMEFKDHRADDDFERMLAELNGKKTKKKETSAVQKESAPKPAAAPAPAKEPVKAEQKPAPAPAKEPVKAEQKPAPAPAKEPVKAEQKPAPAPEKKAETVPAAPAAEAKPVPERKRPAPAKPAAEKQQSKPAEQKKSEKPHPDRRSKLPPKTEAQLERERKEKEEKAAALAAEERRRKAEIEERRRMAAIEKERREREQRMVDQIAEIWDNPALAEGGRVSLNIKTEQRKAIRITIPPEVRRKAEMGEAPGQKTETDGTKPVIDSAAGVKKTSAESAEKAKAPAAEKPAAEADAANDEKTIIMPAIKKPLKERSALIAQAASDEVDAEEKTIEMKRLTRAVIEENKPAAAAAVPEKAAVAASAAVAAASAAVTGQTASMPKAPAGRPAHTAQNTGRPAQKNPQKQPQRPAPAAAPAQKKAPAPAAKPAKAPAAAKQQPAAAMSAGDIRCKQCAIVNVIVCCAIFFGLGGYLMVCQRQSGFIQSENRNLATKPELTLASVLDGSYFTDITKWYTDTIPGREELKPVSSKFSNLFGIKLNDVKLTGDITPVKKEVLESKPETTTQVTINTDFSNMKKTSTTTKKKKTETEKLAEVPEELDDGEWLGSVVVAGHGKNVRALSAFNGTFDMGKKYADTINKYREDLGSSVNIYTMNMPTSAAYYLPKNLKDQFTSQHDCITNIGNNLSGVMNIDVYDTLNAHRGEYIYSRTDHHWQPLGAYYAAQVFSQKAQFDFPDLKTYKEYKIENFVGTMYAYSNYDEELNQNPDTFIYHKPDNDSQLKVVYYNEAFADPQYGGSLFFDYAEGINCYSAILGTDDIIAEIETPVHNGRTLVIIKDSFGNALVPYLTHGFEKIYVVDFRYCEVNAADFINKVGATDVLFAVSLAAAHTESHINAIGNIRIQQGYDVYVEGDQTTQTEPETIIPDQNGDGGNGESTGDGADTDGGDGNDWE